MKRPTLNVLILSSMIAGSTLVMAKQTPPVTEQDKSFTETAAEWIKENGLEEAAALIIPEIAERIIRHAGIAVDLLWPTPIDETPESKAIEDPDYEGFTGPKPVTQDVEPTPEALPPVPPLAEVKPIVERKPAKVVPPKPAVVEKPIIDRADVRGDIRDFDRMAGETGRHVGGYFMTKDF